MFASLLNVNRSFITVVVCRFGLPKNLSKPKPGGNQLTPLKPRMNNVTRTKPRIE